MIVFLLHTYRFFQKHKILLWLLFATVFLVPAFFVKWGKINLHEIQFFVVPMFLLFILMSVLFRSILSALAGMLPSVFGGIIALAVIHPFSRDTVNWPGIFCFALTCFGCCYSFFVISLLRKNGFNENVFKELVISITQRALSVTAIFFCMMLLGTVGMREAGLYMRICIPSAAIFSMIFLPHLVCTQKKADITGSVLLEKFIGIISRYGKIFLVIFIIVAVWLLLGKSNAIFAGKRTGDLNSFIMACMIIIPAGLLYFYGRIELALIASAPLLIAWLCASVLLFVGSISLDEHISIVFSVVFAFGTEISILKLRGLLSEFKFGNKNENISSGTYILFSCAAGIFIMLWLQTMRVHYLYSFQVVSMCILLALLVICITLQPLLFRFLSMKKGRNRRMPMTLSDFIFSVIAFTVFLSGCLSLNVLLPIILILPVRRKIKKIIMHCVMMGFCRFEVYLMFNVKKRIINDSKEDFKKPSLIIANHQSHIDLLLLLMLHPKMIVITNKWVWNNPVYSIVIRYLDFYSISDGYENKIEKLKERVAEGYSVLIFPEGSRSEDSRIMRFHKGAFVVAEQLNLEIVPIIIHGVGDCMNKGENFLKSGTITLKIFNRIEPEDKSYGEDYSTRTKSTLKFFRAEYAKMVDEFGTTKYFRKKLLKNYLYKGPVFEWYARIKTRQEKNYSLFHHLVPRDAMVVDMGCGYGFLSYMLSMTSEKRKITGVDYDPVKIQLANSCAAKNENINFVHSDILEYELTKSDAFILLDVLHYFSEEKQEKLLTDIINNLNENGVIIIRDAEPKHRKRHWGTMYTELFSSFTGFNIRNADTYYFTSAEKISGIISRHGMKMEVMDNSRFTSNLMYVIRK